MQYRESTRTRQNKTLRQTLLLVAIVFALASNTLQASVDYDIDETINGTNSADNLQGDNNDELLSGGDGNDSISGGAGDDVLIGGDGDDIITGGDGGDLLVFHLDDEGIDEVLDFSPEQGDMVVLDYAGFKDLGTYKRANIEVTIQGDLKVRLLDNTLKNVVSLKRSNLTFEVTKLGSRAFLKFKRRFN